MLRRPAGSSFIILTSGIEAGDGNVNLSGSALPLRAPALGFAYRQPWLDDHSAGRRLFHPPAKQQGPVASGGMVKRITFKRVVATTRGGQFPAYKKPQQVSLDVGIPL
jgi:hypothetical protein